MRHVLVGLAMFLTLGCSTSSGSITATVEDGPSKPASTPSKLVAGCASSSTKHYDPNFCIALPDGFVEDRAESQRDFLFVYGSPRTKAKLEVWMTEGDTIERRLRWYQDTAKVPDLGSRSRDVLPGLAAKSVEWESADGVEHHLVLVQGETRLAYCETHFPESDPDPDAVEACMTLRPFGAPPPGSIAAAPMKGPFVTVGAFCRAECLGASECTCTAGLHSVTSVAPFTSAQLVDVHRDDVDQWHLAVTTSAGRTWVSHRGVEVREFIAGAGQRQKQILEGFSIVATPSAQRDVVVFHPVVEHQNCDFGSDYTGCVKESDVDAAIVCGFPKGTSTPSCVVVEQRPSGVPALDIELGDDPTLTSTDGSSPKTEHLGFL